jgi:hypothetical protein
LSKPIKQSIEKLKQDEKIDGWKKTFIVYQSRLEKRKSWKEKTKLLKEMEEKLAVDKSELENENDKAIDEKVDNEENENEDSNENVEIDETKPAKLTRKQIEELVKKDEEYNRSKREVKFSDSESESEGEDDEDEEDEEEDDDDDDDEGQDEEDMNQDSQSDNESEETINKNRKRLLSSALSNSEEDEEEEDSELNEEVDLKNTYVFSKANLKKENRENKPEKELKPLIISQKPAYMEIKQLNLDQLKDTDEIPIESKQELVDEEAEKNMTEHQDDLTTIKLSEDPFFLDSSGNEINNPRIEHENSRYYERSKMFNRTYNELDNDNLMSYSSYDRYNSKKRDMYQSSFKTSLSDNRTRSNYHGNNDFKKRDNFNNNDRKSNNFNNNDRFERNSTNFRQRGKLILNKLDLSLILYFQLFFSYL